MTSPNIEITYKRIRPWAIAYIAAPLVLFLFLWLKPIIGVLLGLLTLIATILATMPKWVLRLFPKRFKKSDSDLFPSPLSLSLKTRTSQTVERKAIVSTPMLFALVLVALIWCFLGGHGGILAQSSDWNVRNALFRDLITHPWPVYYNNGTAALSYYIAYWLPAALIAKAPLALGLPIEIVWPLANIVLLLWTSAGMFLVELLVIATLGPRSTTALAFCVAMLIFFSTPDIIGLPITGQWENVSSTIHLEWWARGARVVGQFSSITTCLFWVFNQAVIPWVCTLCFLNERRFSGYFFIWACCLNCGPFASIGLAVLMLFHGVGVLLSGNGGNSGLKIQLRSIVSIPNIIGIAAAIVVGLFFLANSTTAHTGETSTIENLLSYPLWIPKNKRMAITLILLILVEGLLLPALIAKGNLRKPLFWGAVITLIACPFIRIGQGADFCMRASIPAILCLYVLCTQRLLEWSSSGRPNSVSIYALILCLVLGACTPIVEFYRGFYQIATQGIENVHPDAGSLEGMDFSISNFGTDDPEGTLFFSTLAKK